MVIFGQVLAKVNGRTDRAREWSVSRRTEFILEMLREHVNSWHGFKLEELESGSIEKYLEHPEVDDRAW